VLFIYIHKDIRKRLLLISCHRLLLLLLLLIVKLTSMYLFFLFFHHYLPRADVDELIYTHIGITTCSYLQSEISFKK